MGVFVGVENGRRFLSLPESDGRGGKLAPELPGAVGPSWCQTQTPVLYSGPGNAPPPECVFDRLGER